MKRKKYRLGTGSSGISSGYMTTPSEVLSKNSINLAQAKQAGTSNTFADILTTLGSFTMANSGNLAQAGVDAGIFKLPETMANGGTVGVDPVPDLTKRNKQSRQTWEKRYGSDTQYFIDYLDKVDVSTQRPLRELINDAASKHGVDANFLYNTALSEGLDRYGYFAQGEKLDSYERDELLPYIRDERGLDATEVLGLDTIGNVAPRLIDKGYIDPKEYKEKAVEFGYHNEKGEEVLSAQYEDLGYMLDNFAAFTKDSNDRLDNYIKESGTELSPLGKLFFQNVAYNAGQGNAQKMLDSYREKGYLKDDSFVYNRPDASWQDVHKHAVRRLGAMVGLDEQGVMPFSQSMEREDIPKVDTVAAPVAMASGGTVGQNTSVMANRPVNVEGNEVFETLLGQTGEFKGPSHEAGGIDVSLPEGTNVFSKRIKVDGKTMAERKKKRDRNLTKLEKLLGKNPTDKALQNSLQRASDNARVEEQSDLAVQQMVDAFFGEPGEARNGLGDKPVDRFKPLRITDSDNASLDMGIPDAYLPGITDFSGTHLLGTETLPLSADATTERVPASTSFLERIFGGEPGDPTAGDATALIGNLISGIAPLRNTLRNRAGDTPNINAFENFGQDALEANDMAQRELSGMREGAERRIDLGRRDLVRRGRNSARGVNAMRALDLAAELQANRARQDADDAFSRMLMGVLSQRSQLENVQDQAVMQGEANRDLADRMDRDAFYTQRGKDLANLGTAVQSMGRDINAMELREIQMALINQLSKYGVVLDKDYQRALGKDKEEKTD